MQLYVKLPVSQTWTRSGFAFPLLLHSLLSHLESCCSQEMLLCLSSTVLCQQWKPVSSPALQLEHPEFMLQGFGIGRRKEVPLEQRSQLNTHFQCLGQAQYTLVLVLTAEKHSQLSRIESKRAPCSQLIFSMSLGRGQGKHRLFRSFQPGLILLGGQTKP